MNMQQRHQMSLMQQQPSPVGIEMGSGSTSGMLLPPATAFVPVAAYLLLEPRGRGDGFLLDLVSFCLRKVKTGEYLCCLEFKKTNAV